MKLSNLFKKSTKAVTVKVQKLEKTQLEKVIGGAEIKNNPAYQDNKNSGQMV